MSKKRNRNIMVRWCKANQRDYQFIYREVKDVLYDRDLLIDKLELLK